ncbi:type II secretion system F family protein [Dongshaea marina]|uniref:type II secretion system F family protein n=1 Tax=Dongshaea marina TaxID=2047966 RepID=UPI00131F266E|nr:type II secretion system F family protein [Dongshaea marina]
MSNDIELKDKFTFISLLSKNSKDELFNEKQKSDYVQFDYFDDLERKSKLIKYTATISILIYILVGGSNFKLLESFQMKIAAISICYILLGFVCASWVRSKKKEVIHRVREGVPYVVDLMAICSQTGMSIESSLVYISKEIKFQFPLLSKIIDKIMERSNIIGMRASLNELQENINISEVKTFSYTLNQSIKFGTSIYSVLINLSSDIREVKTLALEEKIGKLSSKMSIPLIVFILLPIVFLITAPGILRMMGVS